jgi:cell wall-associated NlpC family hydrolase
VEKSPFSDVAAGSWYEPAVNWAWGKGVAKGITDNLFAPDAPCSAEACVVFFYRYAQHAGLGTAVPEDTPMPEGVSPWAADAAVWAAGRALLDGIAAPAQNATRGYFAGMLNDFCIGTETVPTVSAPSVEEADQADIGSAVRSHSHKSGSGGNGAPSDVGPQLPVCGKTYLLAAPSGEYLTYGDRGFALQGVDSETKWVLQDAGDDRFRLRELYSWDVVAIENGGSDLKEAEGDASESLVFEVTGGGIEISSAGGKFAPEPAPTFDRIETWIFKETESGTALDFSSNGTQDLGIRTFSIDDGNVEEISSYYEIRGSVELPDGGYTLSGGSNCSIGLKVMYVNSYLAGAGYLDSSYYNYNRYDDQTVAAVLRFQQDMGLYASGETDLTTWLAMGYSSSDWYDLGAYVTKVKVSAYGSDRDEYISAKEYENAGTGYAEGASGKPGTYVSDGGLILQCLYAAGICPDADIIDHARSDHANLAFDLGNDWRLGEAVTEAQPGDLIFYGGSEINHVAIYAGSNKIYDSRPGQGVALRDMYSMGNIMKIVRVF